MSFTDMQWLFMRHSKEKQNDKNVIKNNEPLTVHWQ